MKTSKSPYGIVSKNTERGPLQALLRVSLGFRDESDISDNGDIQWRVPPGTFG